MSTTELNAGNLTKGYYKLDGLAISVPEDFKYPLVHEGDQTHPLHRDIIPEFMHDATSITELQFNDMVRAQAKQPPQ